MVQGRDDSAPVARTLYDMCVCVCVRERVGLQNKHLFLGPTLNGSNPMIWHPNARSTPL